VPASELVPALPVAAVPVLLSAAAVAAAVPA
jgi:hypothetical protein